MKLGTGILMTCLGLACVGAPPLFAAGRGEIPPAISLADARTLCENSNKQFTVGLSQNNPAAIASLYSSDALLQAPGGTEATRRESIARYWEIAIDNGVSGLAMSIDVIAVEGSLIVETGRYALISGSVGVVETGKYLILRKQEAGQWRIFRHIWNSGSGATERN